MDIGTRPVDQEHEGRRTVTTVSTYGWLAPVKARQCSSVCPQGFWVSTHLADLVDVQVGGHELAARRHVDAVHVGEAHRRAGAAQVYLRRATLRHGRFELH